MKLESLFNAHDAPLFANFKRAKLINFMLPKAQNLLCSNDLSFGDSSVGGIVRPKNARIEELVISGQCDFAYSLTMTITDVWKVLNDVVVLTHYDGLFCGPSINRVSLPM